MDGTFLAPGARYPTAEDFEIIKKLQDDGYVFAAASGRPYDNLSYIFRPVADRMLFICENGAHVVYGGKNIVLSEIPRDLAMDVIDCILNMDEYCEVVVSTPEGYILIPKRMQTVEEYLFNWNTRIRAVRTKEEIIDPIIKITLYMQDGITAEADSYIRGLWSEHFTCIASSGPCWIDLQNADKGSALTRSCEYLNIPLKQTAAFGDNYNDQEMLQAAGTAYAMEASPEDLKQIAGNTCSSVQEILRSYTQGD